MEDNLDKTSEGMPVDATGLRRAQSGVGNRETDSSSESWSDTRRISMCDRGADTHRWEAMLQAMSDIKRRQISRICDASDSVRGSCL